MSILRLTGIRYKQCKDQTPTHITLTNNDYGVINEYKIQKSQIVYTALIKEIDMNMVGLGVLLAVIGVVLLINENEFYYVLFIVSALLVIYAIVQFFRPIHVIATSAGTFIMEGCCDQSEHHGNDINQSNSQLNIVNIVN
jgi:hypothetical protein